MVLDGLEDDETRFSLLYEPDKTKNWQTDDLILQQANPVALEIPEIWNDLIKKRAYYSRTVTALNSISSQYLIITAFNS